MCWPTTCALGCIRWVTFVAGGAPGDSAKAARTCQGTTPNPRRCFPHALAQIRGQVYALAGMQPRAKRELLSREEERFVERLLVALGDHLIDEGLAQVPEKYSAGIEKGMGEFRRECQGVPLPTASTASGSHCCAVIRLRESPAHWLLPRRVETQPPAHGVC